MEEGEIVFKNWLKLFVLITIVLAIHMEFFFNMWLVYPFIYAIMVSLCLVFRLWDIFHVCIFLLNWSILPWIMPHEWSLHLFSMSAIFLNVLFLLSLPFILTFGRNSHLFQYFNKELGKKTDWYISVSIFVLATLLLLIWSKFTDNVGAGGAYIRSFYDYPKWSILLIIIPAFSLLNSCAEEFTYRGVFQEAASRTFNNPILILLFQALPYAALHFSAGFPNGVVGYLLIVLYAMGLGYLRMSTGSILLPFIVHLVVDMAVGIYLYFSFIH